MLSVDGTILPCCKYNVKLDNVIMDENIEKENIKDKTINELFLSESMDAIRNDFINNKEPAGCKLCWDEEAKGITSLRMVPNNHFSKIEKPVLRGIEFKFSSLCNLKCRICDPHHSTTWLKEAKDMKIPISHLLDNSAQMTFKDKNDVETFFKLNPNLSTVQFHGGEPQMQPEHKLFMEVLSEQSDEDIDKLTLVYNTNGTHYNEKFIETWNKTKQTRLNLSIDDIEERFEYQRYPAKWSTIVDNINKLKENCNDNVKLILYCTVNRYNIFYLTELIRMNHETFKLDVFFNLLHYAPHLSIKNLPMDVKKIIKIKLESLTEDDFRHVDKREIENIIEYMLHSEMSEYEFDKFFQVTNDHDAYRGQSFEEVFPEYYELLKL